MFCLNCGKEIIEGTKFCTYCGTPVDQNPVQQDMRPQSQNQPNTYGQATPWQNTYGQSTYGSAAPAGGQQTSSYYQPPKKKSNVGLIIGIVAGVLLLFGIIGMVLVMKAGSLINTATGSDVSASDDILEQYTDENGNIDRDKVNEFEVMMADTWESQSVDMTGKVMYATKDGVTKDENSYWEFADNKKAKLVMGDGGYFEGDYIILTDKLGMLYTEFKFQEYGLTYDELLSVTNARIEGDSSCNGYVVIAFSNLEMHNADGSVEPLDSSKAVMYYGVSYDRGDLTLYDIVGANSASYYNFICDK